MEKEVFGGVYCQMASVIEELSAWLLQRDYKLAKRGVCRVAWATEKCLGPSMYNEPKMILRWQTISIHRHLSVLP
jgi:hypothetical protein